jgi:hypothetical protein
VQLRKAEGKDTEYRFCDDNFFVDQEIAAEQEIAETPDHNSTEEQCEDLFLALPGPVRVEDYKQRDICYSG